MPDNIDINAIASKSLGDSTSYAVYTDKFDASLLNFMPRAAARHDWGITGEEFDGFDIWHCYESTFLLDSGQPVAGTLKMKFPVANSHVVESKSMKLYLNTFDMCKMGKTFMEAIRNYENQIVADMKAGGLAVEVRFFSAHVLHSAMGATSAPHVFARSKLIDVDASTVFTDFTAQETHIKPYDPRLTKLESSHLLFTNILRSRCRHTKQKDTGSAFLSLVGVPNNEAILKQIVSLREVNEFHEFCAEKLFVELSKGYKDVGVFLLYSRRGSLDIHPVRYAKGLPPGHQSFSLAQRYGNVRHLHQSVIGQ